MNSKTVLHPILLKHQLFITFLIQPVPEARHHHRRRHHYRLCREEGQLQMRLKESHWKFRHSMK